MAYDFDMQFTYILSKWKRFVHNGKVLRDVINKKIFTIPKEKYYLEDAGYSNSNSLFLPYKKIRYYLKKQAITACCLRNAKKLFYLQYSNLCNIIKQIFGVLKKRFLILKVAVKFFFTKSSRNSIHFYHFT